MSKTVIRGGAQIVGSLPAGTGDNLLTTDGTSLGSISPIDTSTFVSKTLNSGEIIVGNGSNVATAVAMSGDGSISNAGVFAIGAGVIVNADVNASAGITLSKLAATTASRLLVSDGSGFITPSAVTSTEAGYLSGVTSAIQTQLGTKVTNSFTASRALISNGSGNVAVSAVTSTELGYLTGVSSAIQTQLNTKLAATITGAAQGDIIYYNGSAWVNLAKGTTGQVLQSTAGSIQWASGASNGQPTGGTVGQYLRKSSSTDYDSAWDTLTISDVSDISASAAELNLLDGVTTTTTQFNFLNTLSGDVQAQLAAKLPIGGATYTTTTGDGLGLTSSTLTTGNLVSITTTGTAAASNTKTGLFVGSSGANGTSTQTTYAGRFSNTNTGTSSTNIGLYSTATGGTTNWSIYGLGNIGLQIGSAPSATRQGFTLFDNTATERGFLGITSSAVLMGAGSGYPLYLYGGGGLSGAITTAGKWQVMDTPDSTSRAKLYVAHAVNNTTPVLRVDGAIDTNLTASTEKLEVDFNFNRNKNFATGALTTQREFLIRRPTYSFTGASTLTDAYTMFIDGAPAAGSNATITRSWAAGFDGNVFIGGNTSIPSSGYINVGTTLGTSGYGFRDNAGTMEFKNSGGSWAAFGGGGFSDPMSTRGDIIIRNASNVTARLGIGAANQSLVSDGTDISWGYLGQLRTGTETFALASSTLTMSVTTFGSVLSLTRSGLGSLDTAATFGVFGAANPSGNAGNLHLRGGNSSGSNGWGGDVYIYYGTKNGSGKDSNIGLHTTSVANWQSMERGVYLANRAAAPTTGIADGIALFAEDSNSSSELYVTAETGAKVNISGLFEPVTESGTTITLNETHRNKIVLCSNSGVVTVTVGSGKAAGWNCMLVATHATGTITLSASGTTINGTTVTTAQFETLSLVHYGSENYLSKLG